MYLCTDPGNAVCEDHVRFGSDGLERCARCNTRRERADAGPPPPPPGGGGGQGGPSGQGAGGCGAHGPAPFPPPGPGHPGGGQGPLNLTGRVVGLLPGGYPGGAPGFHGTVADSHGAGNNQCGSSFYGPTEGGGVYHQGVGAGATLLQATLPVSGMPVILERVRALVTVSTVFFLKQSGETTGETSAPSVALESPVPVLLLSHALAVE